jgi:hypothetical protein
VRKLITKAGEIRTLMLLSGNTRLTKRRKRKIPSRHKREFCYPYRKRWEDRVDRMGEERLQRTL